MGDILDLGELSEEQIRAVEAECERFIAELPPIFSITDPDLSHEQDHPYLAFQRYQLHAVIYMVRVHLYKPYLAGARDDKAVHTEQFRQNGITHCLELLKLAGRLFDHEFPNNAKFHLVVFCLFDTATLLCSAMMHANKDLHRRSEVMDALNYTLSMLYQLSKTTKIGASSYHFLAGLIQAIPESSRLTPSSSKRQKTISDLDSSPENLSPENFQAFAPTLLPVEANPISDLSALGSIPLEQQAKDFPFDFTQFSEFDFSSAPLQLDMGGLEYIWDWEHLHLDGFLGQQNVHTQC
jgi:hypothetical protein